MQGATLTAADLDAYRPLLVGHCYRMLGHPQDADDAVQDTFVRAIDGLAGFEGRASLKTWLVRIATNVCLDEIGRRKRRQRPMAQPVGRPDGDIVFRSPDEWIGPLPDTWVVEDAGSPFEQLAVRRSIRLAFVAALQQLPPKQRAALLLSDVLEWSAKEVAAALDSSEAAINSALARARAKLGDGSLESSDEPLDQTLIERYASAFERFDISELVTLLAEDVQFSMPPIALWLQGPAHVADFLLGPGHECEGSLMIPLPGASGWPAFAQYRDAGKKAWGLVVLELRGDLIAGINTFLDVETLFPLFGLPLSQLPDR